MEMISIKDNKENEWKTLKTTKASGTTPNEEYGWLDGQFRYSPNGRYAAFTLNAYVVRTKNNRLYIVNMFTKQFTHYTTNEITKLEGVVFFYWLNDSEMMIYLDNQRHVLCRVDHLKRRLDKIDEQERTVWADEVPRLAAACGLDEYLVRCTYKPYSRNGTLRFSLQNQEYLMVRTIGRIVYLKPYRLQRNTEPHQNMLAVYFWSGIAVINQKYLAYPPLCFGYKDKMYCFLQETGNNYRERFDKFLCFDLTLKEIADGAISVDEEDAVIFEPKQIGPGSFWSDKCFSAWQEGHILILTENQPCDVERAIDDPGDRFWILDLEKETIREILVELKRLSRVTLYEGDSLMLWSYPWNEEKQPMNIKYKQILRKDIMPRLKSICSAKLLSQKRIEKNKVAERFIFRR